MEHGFFIDDKYYSEISDFAETFSEQEINEMDEDERFGADIAKEESVFQLSADWILGRFEERFSEEGDDYAQTRKILEDNIDFAKINSLLPKLFFATRERVIITKQDLLNESQ